MPFLFLLFIIAVAFLAVLPVLLHPALPRKTRRRLSIILMIVITLPTLTLYILLGVPQLAVF